jgi:[ribosomal protein S5]-alanine N-acetyltransferase
MRLETDRLIIRPWTMEEADAAFAIYGDSEVMRYVGDGRPSPDIETMRASLAKLIERDRGKQLGLWALEKRDSGEVIGSGLLKPLPDNSDIEVGYHLAQKWWGQGYATEAATALVEYGLSNVGLSRIVGVTYPENVASQRVLTKAGLVHKGKSRYGEIEVELFVIERPKE